MNFKCFLWPVHGIPRDLSSYVFKLEEYKTMASGITLMGNLLATLKNSAQNNKNVYFNAPDVVTFKGNNSSNM